MGPDLSGAHVFSSMVWGYRSGHENRGEGSALVPSHETLCCRDSRVLVSPMASNSLATLACERGFGQLLRDFWGHCERMLFTSFERETSGLLRDCCTSALERE